MIKTNDGKEVLEDGERLFTNLMLMDSMQKAVAEKTVVTDTAGHRPGFVQLSDADEQKRADAYDKYVERISNAWQNPAPVPASMTADKAPAVVPANGDRAAIYDSYDTAIQNRWKGTAAA